MGCACWRLCTEKKNDPAGMADRSAHKGDDRRTRAYLREPRMQGRWDAMAARTVCWAAREWRVVLFGRMLGTCCGTLTTAGKKRRDGPRSDAPGNGHAREWDGGRNAIAKHSVVTTHGEREDRRVHAPGGSGDRAGCVASALDTVAMSRDSRGG